MDQPRCHYCGKPCKPEDHCDDTHFMCCAACWFSDEHQDDIDDVHRAWDEYVEENS